LFAIRDPAVTTVVQTACMGARRGWRKPLAYAAGLAVALPLGACSGDSALDVDVLGSWGLVSGSTPAGPLGVAPGSRVSLTFEDGRMGGRAPCNDYGSDYDLDGEELELTGDGMSMSYAGCDGAQGDLESAYLSALGDVETVTRDADTLTLRGDAVALEFRLTPPWPRADVVGHTWRLHRWTDESGTERRPEWKPGMRPFLRLEENGGKGGRITASTGCRSMTGRWTDWRDAPALTRSGWTGHCPQSLMEQQMAVGSVLSEPVLEVRDRAGRPELVVRDAHGTGESVAVYRR
jgi:heat shock protein HslJ